jgi:hypothetical protein
VVFASGESWSDKDVAKNHWEGDRFDGRWEIFRDEPDHGWIPWHGGLPPFTTGDVDVRLRSGRFIFYRGIVHVGGRKNEGGNWVHLGEMTDIVAYRRHPKEAFAGDREEIIPF